MQDKYECFILLSAGRDTHEVNCESREFNYYAQVNRSLSLHSFFAFICLGNTADQQASWQAKGD